MVAPVILKSLVPEVENDEDIDNLVGQALMYQYMFERKTSPWEMASWDEKELMDFKIDEEKIDRLYAIDSCEEGNGYSDGRYSLLARMKHKDGHVFVSLYASCDSSGFQCQGGGEIYVTANANIFYNTACDVSTKDSILASLSEDGYDITPQATTTRCPVTSWHNPCSLKLLCHVAIKDNRHRLAHYPDVLPVSLIKSVDEFIRVREAMEDY